MEEKKVQGEQTPQTTQAKVKKGKEDSNIKEIVRILHTDISGNANVYTGLTRIKGISWTISNALTQILNLDKSRKVGTLNDDEISRIEHTIKNLSSQPLPNYLFNRPRTLDGVPKHLLSSDLELQTKMGIKRLKEIQSYRGVRHALGLPVRGQRTRSHFRHGKTMGVERKKMKQKVGTKKPEKKDK